MATTSTNVESGSQTGTASGYHLDIIVGDKVYSQPELKVFESQLIRAHAGEQYRVMSSDGEFPDNVVAIRTENDLELRFDSGVHLVIDDYYLVCSDGQCEFSLSAEGANEYLDAPFSTESTVVYSQGNISGFLLFNLRQSDVPIEEQGHQTQRDLSSLAVVAEGEAIAEDEGISLSMMSLGAAAGLGLIAAAGGSSSGSFTPNINPELTAPTTTIAIDSISDDSGSPDFITNDNDGLTVSATLSTALVDGETLEYSNDNGATFTDITASSVNGTVISHVDSSLTSTNTIQFRVTNATSNSGAVASQLVTIEVDPDPVFSSEASTTVSENETVAYTAEVTGVVDTTILEYSLEDESNWELFSIDAKTGEVSFIDAPDYERSADVAGDNGYNLLITANNGVNGTDPLRFEDVITLDFTQISDNKITSIEQIDLLSDGGDSSITLNLTDVLNVGEGSNELLDRIDGDLEDFVTLDNDSNGQEDSWQKGDSFIGGGSYEFVGLGSEVLATVLIAESIQVDVMAVI